MSKVAVVYWSGTGNTQMMADAVLEGAEGKGAEVLEEIEFEPMFAEVEKVLSGKKIALFGSYGWGDGQWMRDWEDRCRAAGAELVIDSVIANEAPGDDETEKCRELGAALEKISYQQITSCIPYVICKYMEYNLLLIYLHGP